MSITAATLVQQLSEKQGDFLSFTTTGAGDSTSVISTTLSAYFTTDDAIIGWWLYVTSATCQYEEKQITDYAASTGDCTTIAFSGTGPGNSATVELHRVRPSLKLGFLNRAMERAYPYFYDRKDDRNLVSGNWLIGSHFEDWASSSYPDGWGVTGSPTSCAATTTAGQFRFGSKAVAFDGSASYASENLYQGQDENRRLLDLGGHNVDAYVWAKHSGGVGTAYMQLSIVERASGDITSHVSDACPAALGLWAKCSLENKLVPSDIDYFKFIIFPGTGDASYFDNAVLFGPVVYEYVVPTSLQRVREVYVSSNDWDDQTFGPFTKMRGWTITQDSGTRYLRFNSQLPPDRKRLRIVGDGYFTALSTYASTWNITVEQAAVLVDGALWLYYESEIGSIGARDDSKFEKRLNALKADFENGKRRHMMAQPPIDAHPGGL